MQATPKAVGLNWANWCWKAVKQFVAKHFGKQLKRTRCIDSLHRLGFVLKRPRKRLLKADAEKPGLLKSQERGTRGREPHLTPGPFPAWLYFTHKSPRLEVSAPPAACQTTQLVRIALLTAARSRLCTPFGAPRVRHSSLETAPQSAYSHRA